MLFQRAKIQDFRCNSQLARHLHDLPQRCFKEQRYKILDAIHNLFALGSDKHIVVSKSKDTRF